MVSRWFNTLDFAPNQGNTFGDSGKNALRGSRCFDTDLDLSIKTKIPILFVARGCVRASWSVPANALATLIFTDFMACGLQSQCRLVRSDPRRRRGCRDFDLAAGPGVMD